MTTTSALNSIVLGPPNRPQDLRAPQLPGAKESAADKAEKLHSTFTQFVGQTFYGQMIKAMRSTVTQPAYFNGGQAEKIFQSQLDQTLADQMTKASADRFAEPMFQRQFPNVDLPAQSDATSKQLSGINELGQLTRR
jgi:Rod binding domain-containing protein